MRVLLAALVLLAVPATARAGTVTRDASRIAYQGGTAGETIAAGLDTGKIALTSDVGVSSGTCMQTPPDRVDCDPAPQLAFTLGPGADRVDTTGVPATIAVTLGGGAGDDAWSGGPGPDVFDGGDGTDTVDYSARSAPVSVTVDGIANDGQAGEGDNVVNAEEITGGSGNDTIVAGSNGSRLHGGPGNDTLKGSPQEDRIEGDEGDDTIDSRDGVYDSIDCGPGTDTLLADPGDSATNCEVAPDRDGDGWLNEQDCAPDNPAIHPGAGEIVGNDVDEDCSGGPAYFTVEAGLTFSFAKRKHPSRIRFATLKLNALHKGDAIVIGCRGGGCPFKSKTFKATSSRLDLASKLKLRYLRAGATLEVRVLRPLYNGKVFRLKITAKPAVTQTKLCVGPHSTAPSACG